MVEQATQEDQRRKELIGRVLWNSGGHGYGLCEVAGFFMAAMDAPGPGKPDWVSTVAVDGPPSKYTTEELEKIVTFAIRHDAKYDRMFRYKRGCNLIFFNKREDGAWYRARQSWTIGPMFSSTLDEALKIFERDC